MTEKTEEALMEKPLRPGLFFCKDCLDKNQENKTDVSSLLSGCSVEGKILFCLVQEIFPICENCMNNKIPIIHQVITEQLKNVMTEKAKIN